MTDIVTKEQRSRMMSRIRGKDTKPEMLIRRGLFAAGFRYRLHDKKLPGKPDLVFPKFRTVIFIHGCFWHRHEGCQYAYTPKSRVEFWAKKFEANVRKHQEVILHLDSLGWKIITVWECALRGKERIEISALVGRIAGLLQKGFDGVFYDIPHL